MNPYGTPTPGSGNWAQPTWPHQPADGHAAPGQSATGSAATGHTLPGQPPFEQPGQHGQPAVGDAHDPVDLGSHGSLPGNGPAAGAAPAATPKV